MPLPLLALAALMAGTAATGAAVGAARRSGKARNPLDDQEGADAIDEDPDGFLSGPLNSIGRAGHAVNDLLVGNFEGAGRQAIDLAGDAVDAFLPGDWIHPISRRKDKADFSDVLGGIENPVGKFAADVIGGAATDPTTLIPGAAVGKAASATGGLARKAAVGAVGLAKGAPEAERLVAKGLRGVRRTFGAEKLSPEVQKTIQASNAARSNEARAGLDAIRESGLSRLSPAEDQIVADVMDNFKWDKGVPVGRVGMETLDPIKLVEAHPGVTPENVDRLRDAVADAMRIGQKQEWKPGIFSKKVAPDPLVFGSTTAPQTAFEGDYLARKLSGKRKDDLINDVLGTDPTQLARPSAVKARSIQDPEQLAALLKAEPGVTYERSAVKRLASRAEEQGKLAGRAEVGRSLVGDGFAVADKDMMAAANEAIRKMAETAPEDAKALHDALNGLAPRGTITSLLASHNGIWKKAAVSGFLLPKLGTLVSNKLSSIWQLAANPETRAVAGSAAKNIDGDIAGAISETLGMKYPRDKLRGDLEAINDAFRKSGGAAESASQALRLDGREDLAHAVDNGVLDGFVSSEELLNDVAKPGILGKIKKAGDMPAKMMAGIEARMRLGTYKELLGMGMPADRAAQATGDALYHYGVNSAENRTLRDIRPFAQFEAKAVPQAAKFLGEKPYVAGALSRAMDEGDPDSPVYPFMEGKLNIPIGNDQEGNAQYLSSLRLPFESLSNIPNPSSDLATFGRQSERSLVGGSNPLLKTAFSALSGEDPYFGTPWGSYEKIPLIGDAGEAGRAYNLASTTGLLTAPDSVLRNIGKVTDSRRSLPIRALDVLTGADVVSVDKDRAIQQQLTDRLEANPDVNQVRSLYTRSDDPETKALLEALAAAKLRLKKKRKAASAGTIP
jgi:hypothetical protein